MAPTAVSYSSRGRPAAVAPPSWTRQPRSSPNTATRRERRLGTPPPETRKPPWPRAVGLEGAFSGHSARVGMARDLVAAAHLAHPWKAMRERAEEAGR